MFCIDRPTELPLDMHNMHMCMWRAWRASARRQRQQGVGDNREWVRRRAQALCPARKLLHERLAGDTKKDDKEDSRTFRLMQLGCNQKGQSLARRGLCECCSSNGALILCTPHRSRAGLRASRPRPAPPLTRAARAGTATTQPGHGPAAEARIWRELCRPLVEPRERRPVSPELSPMDGAVPFHQVHLAVVS